MVKLAMSMKSPSFANSKSLQYRCEIAYDDRISGNRALTVRRSRRSRILLEPTTGTLNTYMELALPEVILKKIGRLLRCSGEMEMTRVQERLHIDVSQKPMGHGTPRVLLLGARWEVAQD